MFKFLKISSSAFTTNRDSTIDRAIISQKKITKRSAMAMIELSEMAKRPKAKRYLRRMIIPAQTMMSYRLQPLCFPYPSLKTSKALMMKAVLRPVSCQRSP